jgi:hypothetical protein
MTCKFKEPPYGPEYDAKMSLCEGVKCVETIFSVMQVQPWREEGTALETLNV